MNGSGASTIQQGYSHVITVLHVLDAARTRNPITVKSLFGRRYHSTRNGLLAAVGLVLIYSTEMTQQLDNAVLDLNLAIVIKRFQLIHYRRGLIKTIQRKIDGRTLVLYRNIFTFLQIP